MAGRVILLNGVGSVGKTSVARALQAVTAAPFLLVQMDAFLDMLPPAMLGHPDGLVFETFERDGHPCVSIANGPVMHRTMRGMRHAVAAMAGQGCDMIVDEVILGPEAAQASRALLAGCELRLVGLHAPLEVLEARERARGDRLIGLARWQYGRVHVGVSYDLELDTAASTPAACAEAIRAAFGLG